MINSIQDEGGAVNIQLLVDQGIAEGVTGGIAAFMQHNRVNLKPTDVCMKPLESFVGLFLAEYLDDKSGYPFTESFRDFVTIRTAEAVNEIRALYDNGELGRLRVLLRVIGGAAVAEFLEARRPQVLKLILQLRGE
jgi:hypothetical protein